MTYSYHMRDIDNIKIEHLDYMSLLYDKLSGITHIISQPAPQIIEALGSKSLTPKQVEHYLIKEFEIESNNNDGAETFEDIITARLEEFADLGLVEKTKSPS